MTISSVAKIKIEITYFVVAKTMITTIPDGKTRDQSKTTRVVKNVELKISQHATGHKDQQNIAITC